MLASLPKSKLLLHIHPAFWRSFSCSKQFRIFAVFTLFRTYGRLKAKICSIFVLYEYLAELCSLVFSDCTAMQYLVIRKIFMVKIAKAKGENNTSFTKRMFCIGKYDFIRYSISAYKFKRDMC